MGDADALQLREQPLHPRDQRRGDVGGEADAVAFAPAEEEPAIRAEAVVVHDELGIRDADVLGQDVLPAVGQRLGRGDEGVDRHDAGVHGRQDIGEVSVARDDRVRGGDAARRGSSSRRGGPRRWPVTSLNSWIVAPAASASRASARA
jgi:hypothetical protein